MELISVISRYRFHLFFSSDNRVRTGEAEECLGARNPYNWVPVVWRILESHGESSLSLSLSLCTPLTTLHPPPNLSHYLFRNIPPHTLSLSSDRCSHCERLWHFQRVSRPMVRLLTTNISESYTVTYLVTMPMMSPSRQHIQLQYMLSNIDKVVSNEHPTPTSIPGWLGFTEQTPIKAIVSPLER